MNRKESNQSYQSTYDIYVGNVPKNINEVDVRNIFIRYGEIKQVLCRWKEDYFGYSIVKFVNKNDAERVLRQSTEVTFNGHTMPVKAARRSDHSHNGNIPIENKLNSYPEMSKNQMYNGLQFSNTDYGYFQQPKYPEEPPGNPQPMLLEVLCSAVENAVTFYGCPVSRTEELSLITNAVNSLNLNFNRYERRPINKRVYAALYSADNTWYRCQVICNALPKKPGMCYVRYIDFGNEEEISYRNIVELPESLQKVPPFASRFFLSNLVCETKPSVKKSYLHQLVNKRMSLCAFLTPNFEYQVVKCSCNGKDVISETINKGFAKLQRSSPPKIEAQHSELPHKPKAYAHGSEILLKSNGTSFNHNSAPKAQENQSGSNVTVYSIKSRPKTEDSSLKKDVSCNGVTDETKKESDFHPKMIIKRGSELSEIVCPSNSANKAKESTSQQSYPTVIDNVISNLKLINDIRGLVSKSSDDSIINSAVSLFKEELNTMEGVENSIKSVGDALDEYHDFLNKIKVCTDKTQLPDLKTKRDTSRINLCDKLKEYLASCDNSIFDRKDKIQKTITDLESNSNAWMNVHLEKASTCMEELISEYNKVKDKRWSLVCKTRESTNQKHKKFMQVFEALKKELYLNISEETNISHTESPITGIGKTTSYSEKWDEALKELAKSLDEEIHMLTVNKDSRGVSVIQCLLDVLDVHKEKIDCVCELYENRFALYNELIKVPDVEAISSELKTVHADIEHLTSDIGQLEDSVKANKEEGLKTQFPSRIKQLHELLLREDCLKEALCNAAVTFFPELLFEHPELKLSNYTKTRFLLKDWKREYFLVSGEGTRGETSYASSLLDDTIDIKEYKFDSTEEVNAFVQKVVTWNTAKSESLVKIKASFVKEEEKTVCVLLPTVSNTLLNSSPSTSASDGEKACRILRQVLVGLRDIHSLGIIHRSVHPSTILIENEKACLDFCFDPNYLNGKTNLKGLNFHPPESRAMHESADMYGYGCILLWVLFPNLSFTTNEMGVPNLAAFRSIVEEMILPKDYALLSALLDAKPEKRPSAATLLNKGFLTKYETYCRSRGDSQKKILN